VPWTLLFFAGLGIVLLGDSASALRLMWLGFIVVGIAGLKLSA
jgi:hypothetical protein